MAKVVIGGTEYEVPELNFVALELAWPHIIKAQQSLDPMQGVSAAITVIAAGLSETLPFDYAKYGMEEEESKRISDAERMMRVDYFLKKKLKSTEMDKIRAALVDIVKEAGLETEEGEDEGDEDQTTPPSPSPEIVQQSLPN